MSQLRLQVDRLNHAITSSLHYGALAEDIQNFPGLANIVAGAGITLTPGAGTLTIDAGGGGLGTVTSVGMSVPSFLSVAGSPVTTSGTLAVSYSGTALPIANGGTSATSAAAALTALGAYPATNPNGYTSNTGTVTSVGISTASSGVSVTSSPVTGSGTIALGLKTMANVDDAPADGTTYGRNNNAWVAAGGGGSSVQSPGCVFSNGNLLLTGTLTSEIQIPYGGTIEAWTIAGDAAGDASIIVSHATYAAYSTMTTLFTATCTGSNKAQATGLSHTLTAGDILRFSGSGFSLFTRVSITLEVN